MVCDTWETLYKAYFDLNILQICGLKESGNIVHGLRNTFLCEFCGH